jgi:plastocyanin
VTRAILALVVAAAVLAAAVQAAEAPTRTISMPTKAYVPPNIDVLVGTTVTWKNDDSINHTATADGDAFASGFIPPGGSFSFSFAKQGHYTFHCSIHRFMKGEVNVFGLVLSGPEGPVATGQTIVFAGLAPPGTAAVALQGGRAAVTVRARPDGSFVARVAVAEPTVFRAVAGRLASPRVRVFVKPHVAIVRSGNVLSASVEPSRRGARVLLQSYDRERFDWVVVARAKLDVRSRARFTLPRGLDRVRVLVRGSKGWADASSTPLILGRSAA